MTFLRMYRGETATGSPCSVHRSHKHEATFSSHGTSSNVERSGLITISAKPCSQLLNLRLGSTTSAMSQPKSTSHCPNPSSSEFRKYLASTRLPRQTPSISGAPLFTYSILHSPICYLIL